MARLLSATPLLLRAAFRASRNRLFFDHRQLRELADRGSVSGLIKAMARLLYASRTADVPSLALKFRSQTLFIAELLWNALPEAQYVFMYRDALGWGESFFQFLIDVEVPMPFDEAGRNFFWMMNSADKPLDALARFVDLEHRPISSERVLVAGWIIHVEEYLRLLGRGMPFLGLRYNDLVRDPDGELTRLFSHCRIPLPGVAAALQAFAGDSQKGTAIARKGPKRKFDEVGVEEFRETLARVPNLKDPMTKLPDLAS